MWFSLFFLAFTDFLNLLSCFFFMTLGNFLSLLLQIFLFPFSSINFIMLHMSQRFCSFFLQHFIPFLKILQFLLASLEVHWFFFLNEQSAGKSITGIFHFRYITFKFQNFRLVLFSLSVSLSI